MDEKIIKKTKTWQALFTALAIRALGKESGNEFTQKYLKKLPSDYRSLIPPRYALKDILELERLSSSDNLRLSLIKPYKKNINYRLQFYSLREYYLDEFIPVLENLSLRVVDHAQFTFNMGNATATVKSFIIKPATSQYVPFNLLNKRLLETIEAVMTNRVENDELNKLCVLTGLGWQEIDVLRAYRNYYLQLGHRTTRASFHHALNNNPPVALDLFQYFEARFKPNPEWEDFLFREEQALFPLRLQLQDNINLVVDINDDRILRTIFNLIDATVRTSFYLRRTQKDYFIALKINSLGVIDMPSPKPQWEIYVHAVDMEGIHLRAGKVSRGGIRWSDRPDDFRTEILDLMQTQINKNALIIPTGAKGGFIIKNNGLRQDFKAAGKQAYIRLMQGLLDLTDNYRNSTVMNPETLIVYDDPDPYLVVAADKGTAKFSDLANSIALNYSFWLGDAFASGGSRGYNHKELGITARGAWECVKRHFLELGKNIQQEAFTVIGIGSMDGDVFGNAMLLSHCIRLQAAFSGQHIFIDPNPQDLETTFKERKRLFELPGSTWDDYNRKLISKGGGVYRRADKDIPVSPELKKWLGIRYKTIDGESLIRYLLTAEVELLWLGGIGTYVKASTEKHEEADDRGNDSVRVDASDLKAKVVGEGANLGFTQKARIEYNLRGGRINTDAVDNSAGVDTSDHEVNIKILLSHLQKKGFIADYQVLFGAMTDAVCSLVLSDNIQQSLCLSLDQLRCADNPLLFQRMADRMEISGFLDRTIESFAESKEIQARPSQTISRPELATLMAASKKYVTQQLQNHSQRLQTGCYNNYLMSYFPAQLNQPFKEHLNEHPLATEIIATVISNKIINQAGCGFLSLDAGSLNGAKVMELVDCYLTFEQILQADTLRNEINALANCQTESQYLLLIQVEQALSNFCRWCIEHDISICPEAETLTSYRKYWLAYEEHLKQRLLLQDRVTTNNSQLIGLPKALALKMAVLAESQNFPFVINLLHETQQNIQLVLTILDDIDSTLGLIEVYKSLDEISLRDDWEQKVAASLYEDLQQHSGKLLSRILSSHAQSCSDFFNLSKEQRNFENYKAIYLQLQNSSLNTLMPYVVLIKALGNLVE